MANGNLRKYRTGRGAKTKAQRNGKTNGFSRHDTAGNKSVQRERKAVRVQLQREFGP